MNWLATLRRSGGIHALARLIDASPADVMAGSDALLPILLDRMRALIGERGGGQIGAKALVDLLTGLGDGNLAAEIMGPNAVNTETGEMLLGHLFASDDDRRRAEKAAADTNGIELSLLQRLSPPLAMLIGGYIAARAGGSGAAGSGGLAGVTELLELSGSARPRTGLS